MQQSQPAIGPAIGVENLGKRFNRYHAEKPMTVMEAALAGFRRIRPMENFWALKEVSFEVAAGEMLGVLGHNGAGKSTLLQLLGKVAHPSEGAIKLRGRIGALLDLGAGLHGDLTGRENLFVSAIVAGLPRQEVARRFEDIVEFAELTNFIENPVRTYSTGMMMRLAFSVAVHTDPDILLVDEFLSVGDLAFQSKCLNRIQAMKAQGCAIVLVSHDVGQIQRLCDRALWLKQGRVMAYGEPATVAAQYALDMRSPRQNSALPQQSTSPNGTVLVLDKNRFGSLEAEMTQVQFLPSLTLCAGDPLCVEITYQIRQDDSLAEVADAIESAIFCVTITQRDDTTCLDVNTLEMGIPFVALDAKGSLRFQIDRLDLAAGEYFVNVGMYKQDWSYAYDLHWQAYPLTIAGEASGKGILNPPMRWELSFAPQALANDPVGAGFKPAPTGN
jgi:lipopolysaccharide transport system ATP-binding protein